MFSCPLANLARGSGADGAEPQSTTKPRAEVFECGANGFHIDAQGNVALFLDVPTFFLRDAQGLSCVGPRYSFLRDVQGF